MFKESAKLVILVQKATFSFIFFWQLAEIRRNLGSKTVKALMETDILFSRTVKAGQRIYYIDVKQNRRGEQYLCITESKKMQGQGGTQEMPQVSFEKHKIFLYREDFEKFQNGINEAIAYIENAQGKAEPRPESNNEDIKIDMEF